MWWFKQWLLKFTQWIDAVGTEGKNRLRAGLE